MTYNSMMNADSLRAHLQEASRTGYPFNERPAQGAPVSHLSEHQFGTLYHGTGHEIKGNKILPNDQLGHESDSRSGAVAYASPSEETAWSFAAWNNPEGRQKVYEVTPGPNAHHVTSDYASEGEVAADHLKIGKRHDIMPGRQGTFPQVNWADHAAAKVYQGDLPEINHPDWDDPSFDKDRPLVNTRTMAGMQAERTHIASLKRRFR